MPTLKMVMDYSGLNFHEALALPCDLYMLMFKHAIIEKLNQTEEGREYLAKCERLKETTPNIQALKERYNK